MKGHASTSSHSDQDLTAILVDHLTSHLDATLAYLAAKQQKISSSLLKHKLVQKEERPQTQSHLAPSVSQVSAVALGAAAPTHPPATASNTRPRRIDKSKIEARH